VDRGLRTPRAGSNDRFRLFGYDAGGNLEQEITDTDGAIEWRVHLVSHKATADSYAGVGRRNATSTDPAARAALDIDAGPQL
jgi:hypothetical protein